MCSRSILCSVKLFSYFIFHFMFNNVIRSYLLVASPEDGITDEKLWRLNYTGETCFYFYIFNLPLVFYLYCSYLRRLSVIFIRSSFDVLPLTTVTVANKVVDHTLLKPTYGADGIIYFFLRLEFGKYENGILGGKIKPISKCFRVFIIYLY